MKRRLGRYTVEIGHSDKIMFPDDGLTKADVVEYYENIAQKILPHLKDRPLTMERYPDGIGRKGFIQKKYQEHFPDWFQSCRVEVKEGREKVPVCNNTASLVYLADQASITQHVWLARVEHRYRPDQMIFDLDPPKKKPYRDGFASVRQAARDCLELFDELKLPAYLKTTGSRGVHLVIPLRQHETFDQVRDFARRCAEVLVHRFPDRYTLEQRIEKRGQRLYLDIQRNAYGQTAVAPFSLRCKSGAPVATPISREQLDDSDLHSQSYRLDNICRHLDQTEDPWGNMRRKARSLGPAEKRLASVDR